MTTTHPTRHPYPHPNHTKRARIREFFRRLIRGIGFATGRAAIVFSYSVGAIFLWAAVIAFGPLVERTVAPVITDFSVVYKGITLTDNLWMVGRFYKRRDCQFLGLGALARNGVNGDWQTLPVDIEGIDPGGTPEPLPLGWNISRTWTIVRPLETVPDVTYIWMVLTYDCGFPWMTTQRVGPFVYWGRRIPWPSGPWPSH